MFERIRALAGSALAGTEALTVEGTIVPAKERYRLTLLVRSGHDARKREITSDSCEDLAGAAAVSVALLLGVDPSTVDTSSIDARPEDSPNAGASKEGTADERKQGEKPPPPNPASDPKAEPSPESATSSESSRRWAVLLRAPTVALDFGPLPEPAFGIGFGVGMRFEAWRIVLAGRVSRGQTLEASTSAGAIGAELDRFAGELATCRGFRSSRFEVAPCLGLALEHLNAQGVGEGITPTSQRATWAALGVGGLAHWYALESLAFFAGVTGYVQFSRPRIVVEGVGELAQLAPVALGATFGAEWIL